MNEYSRDPNLKNKYDEILKQMAADKHWKVRKYLAELIFSLLEPLVEHHQIFSSNNGEKQRRRGSEIHGRAKALMSVFKNPI